MLLINKMHYDDGLIKYILEQAGLDTSRDFTLVVEPLENAMVLAAGGGDIRGLCIRCDGITYVQVDNGAGLDILAHELKHVEQHENGLTEWIVAEKAVSKYDDQWHEVEAWEFGNKWK
jgi:hypothetical protein